MIARRSNCPSKHSNPQCGTGFQPVKTRVAPASSRCRHRPGSRGTLLQQHANQSVGSSLMILLLSTLIIAGSSLDQTFAQPPSPPDAKSPAPSKPRRVQYARFVLIDWSRRAVEIDVEVVLRAGPLELLACSPHTREHESILRVPARPLRVFEAMGLVGLEPGSPASYDDSRRQWKPAHGSLLDIRIKWKQGGAERESPAHRWLFDVKKKKPVESVHWVFAGSLESGGRFGADIDGTVISVVDFPTPLIALDVSHVSDNEALWLMSNTDAIPPVGTKCVLVIRAVAGRRIVVAVRPDGTLLLDADPATPERVAKLVEGASTADRPAVVRIEPVGEVGGDVLMGAVDSIVAAGISRSRVMPFRRPSVTTAPPTKTEPRP